MNIHKYAAIDIGSNAMRLLIMTVIEGKEDPLFIKDTYIRLPVRLGSDAFVSGKISEENAATKRPNMTTCPPGPSPFRLWRSCPTRGPPASEPLPGCKT